MQSQTELIRHLVDSGALRTPALIEAFSLIDRKDFVPREQHNIAYADHPLPIGHDATISQPTTVAFMLELLEARKGDNVLDIGAGSGWTTALLGCVVGKQGMVLGTEIVPELVEQGHQNISKYNLPQCCIDVASQQRGMPAFAPFDRILVSASANILPLDLIRQLTDHGVLVVPVQQSILRIRRSGAEYSVEDFSGFAFVPLQDERERGAASG